MRPNKKQARDLEKLKAMLVAAGVATKDVVEQAADLSPTGREAISRQGDAILLFLESPAKFTTKQCQRKECGEWFGTNYRSVGYCSDSCRGREISRQTGLKWDYRKDEFQRWGGEPPLVIDPVSLKKLKQFVAALQQPAQSQIETSLPLRVPQPVHLPSPPVVQEPLSIPDKILTIPAVKPSPLVSANTPKALGYPFDF